jgi:hypothetical protein
MPTSHTPPRSLSLEALEGREMPAVGEWLVEPFLRGPVNNLPSGWGQWSNDGSRVFQVDPAAAGHGDSGRLVAAGRSSTAGRAWVTSSYSVNVETSASVFLNSTAPIQLFVRGQNLNGTAPTYYAASVVRGGEVQLLKVVNGQTTVLGTVRSAEWMSNRWVTVSILAADDVIQVRVHRGDTNQYLAPTGQWTRQPVAAVEKKDAAIKGSGYVGFSRYATSADPVALDSLRIGPSGVPTRNTLYEDRFADGKATGLPTGWASYASAGAGLNVRTETDETLRVDARSNAVARAWLNRVLPADVQISSSIYVDSLTPAGLIARGTSLHTATPTYYALEVKRGLEASLVAVVNGRETVLGTVKSRDYVSGLWVQASITVKGSAVRAQVFRSDTGQYLNADGTWGLNPTWALVRTNTAIRGGERAGLLRDGGPAGELMFDNFITTAAPVNLTKPGIIPTEEDKTGTPIVKPPEYTPPPPVPPRVPPVVPPVVPPTVPPPVVVPPVVVPPTVPPASPPALPPVVSNPALPAVPRNFSHIRVANLAYYGTPFGSFETDLLKNGVDLVIPNTAYLNTINQASPTTPQFIYTNVTNIYLGVYTDWLEYADRNRLNRESAFYHVSRETSFIGLSASAVPVDKFWSVQSGNGTAWTNVTSSAQQRNVPFAMAGVNQSVAFGYPEKFRELNFDLNTPAGSTWAGKLEYVAAVDSSGKPTKWNTLTVTSDSTTGFKRDGKITFDPPKDWVAASVNGSARLFYARVLTTGAGTPPAVNTATGRDYTNFRGAQLGGTIPAFDSSADKDGDGYLNDREWATRKAGHNARFLYESRLFYPTYGPNRFATNVGNAAFQAWAVDYHIRALKAEPLADGFFVDNSTGKIAVDPTGIKEVFSNYAADHGKLLGEINKRLGSGKWIIANTAGAGTTAEPIARNGVSMLEEFALRPLTANHVQVDDLAATLKYRRELAGGKAYEILDSLPQGIDAADPRVQTTTLAMYYIVADPNTSFLMMNGGNEPASGWKRHWTDAIKFNVGRPTGDHRVWAEGQDPANRNLTYKVYRRDYQNAMVLYKPLAYTRGVNGTTANNTATTHTLGGNYRVVNANGTLGPVVNKITLRNGEGVVLAKA